MMKIIFRLTVLSITALYACRQAKFDTKIFAIDSRLQDTAKQHLHLISSKNYSMFETPIEARYFVNDQLEDSIIQPDFSMTSWYSNNKDTINLVAHIGEFETSALLIRFVHNKPHLFYYRAPHGTQKYFRLNKTDSFTHDLEIPPVRYKLLLSQVPDTINKTIVFGQIDMESSSYFDKRDTLQQRHSIKMKFSFRSQYRKFNN